MTEVIIEMANLRKENDSLKQQIAGYKQGVDGLLAELDAHKQILNGTLQDGITLRTQIVLLQKQNKECQVHIQNLKNLVDEANAKLQVQSKESAATA